MQQSRSFAWERRRLAGNAIRINAYVIPFSMPAGRRRSQEKILDERPLKS
jgi:hypothetical protein